MTRYRLPFSAACIAALSLCVAPPSSGADVCPAIAAATSKIWSIPVHIYSTTQTGPGARARESIYTGGANGEIYVMMRGQWRRSPITVAQLKSEQAAHDKRPHTCRYLRDENVNGEPAAVYSAHSEADGFKVDSTIWISKSRNVPLKTESDMDLGGSGKNHSSARYDYSNVQVPPGVK